MRAKKVLHGLVILTLGSVLLATAVLATVYLRVTPITPVPTAFQIPAAVIKYCGFSGENQPRQELVTAPDGEVIPVKIWETWSLTPNEDDDLNDGLDAARCELYFEIIIVDGHSENLVLNIHQDGPLGITASREAEVFDDFATDDLLTEMGMKWIRDLRLRDRAYVKLFWITATRETVVHRRMVSERELNFIIRDVADSYGIGDGFTNLPIPEEIANLPGYNYVQIREQCWRESLELSEGKHTFACERVVDIFIDDPSTEDIDKGTVSLTIHPDRLSATKHAGAFAIYTPGPDPHAVVEQYGLADLTKEYCPQTERVTFQVNLYTGEVSDEQVVTCSQ